MIVVYEQEGVGRAECGEKTLATLSRCLTSELGRGFSKTNLYNMRRFYLSHQIFQTVSGKIELVALLRASGRGRRREALLLRARGRELALGGLSNAIFASAYTLRLPDKEQLEEQVRRTIEANERKLLDAAPPLPARL